MNLLEAARIEGNIYGRNGIAKKMAQCAAGARAFRQYLETNGIGRGGYDNLEAAMKAEMQLSFMAGVKAMIDEAMSGLNRRG